MNMPKQTGNDIGVFGGTFDPIHYGHLNAVSKAAKWLALSHVYLIPAHIPPHKNKTVANAKQRATMVALACQEQPLFQLDRRELNRNTPSYTVETLKEISVAHPTKTIYFFMGMDALLTFTTWHQWQAILQLCHLVVCSRAKITNAQYNQQTHELLANHQINLAELAQQNTGGILFAPINDHDISSTEIRQLLKQQKIQAANYQPLMPKAVFDYIQQQQLYL